MPQTGWQKLGEMLGGGGDTTAYDEALLHGARTQDALAKARINRDIAMSRENARQLDFNDPNVSLTDIILGDLGSNFQSATGGRGNLQEQGFRAQIADPETDMAARQYAAQAVAGRPESFLQSMGAGEYTDIRDPAGGVIQTDLAKSLIDERAAREALARGRLEDPQRFLKPGAAARTPEERARTEFLENYGSSLGQRAAYFDPQDPTAEGSISPEAARASLEELFMPTLGAGDQDAYLQLAPGTRFIAPDGTVRIKP